MSKPKFDEADRSVVISELERQLSVKLTRPGRQNRILYDQGGRLFWILGGYGDWHGVTWKMIQCAREHPGNESTLVIAKRYPSRVDIYAGPLEALLESIDMLHLTKAGGYQFNTRVSGDKLAIKEVDGLSLRRIGKICSHSREELERMVARMPRSERCALFNKFNENRFG